MSIKNTIFLITYADSMGRDLKDLREILKTYFQGVIGGIHLLPFFPSSADRGFAPMTYEVVAPEFGTWDDIKQLGRDFNLIYDFMINHVSRQSKYFQDFKNKKDRSVYADLFIRYKDFWPQGEPSVEEVNLLYKRKPKAPYVTVEFMDGTKEKIWCTFGDEQIDLNVRTEIGKGFIRDSLIFLAEKGAGLIRLDAFAYAIKKLGSNCFFVEPEVWELLEFVTSILKPYGVEILPEIHEHYSIQLKLAEKGYWVYDFALPMLLLHALYSGTNQKVVKWLQNCPRKQFTTLDTHDGIGVVDVRDLLSEEEIEETKEYLYSKGANVKRIYNTVAYGNLDIYQINCTYYSALGNNDQAYLLARAIQFFAPGIPQVYYVGLLAGENDLELLEKTRIGRNINRHCYTRFEIEENLKRPVVKKLVALMRFRNSYPAFGGEYSCEAINDELLTITWQREEYKATLKANLKTHRYSIIYFDPLQDTDRVLPLS